MELIAKDIMNYHCPRWNELPEIELYIDQVVAVLQNNLSLFAESNDNPVITAAMINNYVKKHVLKRPVKKKYGRSHLAYLFVVCTFKKILSISQIREAIIMTQKVVSVEEGYNMFCEELEKALIHTFNPDLGEYQNFDKNDIREVTTLKTIVKAFADSVLVERLIHLKI